MSRIQNGPKSLSQLKGDTAASRIILREISRIRGPKKGNGSNVFIQCCFHAGDRTPSLSISVDPAADVPIGTFFCFGCGATGRWNTLAEKKGLAQVKQSDHKKDRIANHDTETDRRRLLGTSRATLDTIAENEGYGFMLPFPEEQSWRRIPGWLLHKIGARLIYDKRNEDTAVILPVTVRGDVVGAVKATRVKRELSYVTSGRVEDRWVRQSALFPIDYAVSTELFSKYRTLVIVEGPRDALRLLRHGIPTVAILGSQSWSARKRNLLLSFHPKHVILIMDSDTAGIKATKTIGADIDKYMRSKKWRLNRLARELGMDKVDPGNLPLEYVSALIKQIKSLK